jgi:enterochelin esterase-like enzyme
MMRAMSLRLRPTALLVRALLGVAIFVALIGTPGARGLGGAAEAGAVTPAGDTPPSPARTMQRHLWSEALGREMPYLVFLPPGYDSGHARYPVLYLLHGLGGDFGEWSRLGATAVASRLMSSGEIPPMILVMPEGGRGYWVDRRPDGPRYGSYVSQDLVAHIDREFRTSPHRRSRAIGGISMGGHGALDIALNHPDRFGVIGAHSMALRRSEDALEFFGNADNWKAHHPPSICQNDPQKVRRARFALWIDIGSGDRWAPENRRFHAQLEASGIAHTWREAEGGHDAAYWSANMPEYLRYYASALRTPSRAP